MCDRNAKSKYVLIKLCALVFESICERTIKISWEKNYLIAELFIFKHRRQNISISNTELLTAVTCPEVIRCVVRTHSTFSRSVMVSVAVSSLGHTDLFFIDQGTKSIIIEMSCFINSFCQPFATYLATSLLLNRTTLLPTGRVIQCCC